MSTTYAPSVEARTAHEEELRSFDVLATVHRLRYDLAVRGEIREETLEQVYDEELSYIAEGINRPLRTEFTFQQQDGELVYFDRGEWRPYMSMLVVGVEVAEREARADPRKTFLAERAGADLKIGYRMQNLRPGERMVWDSPFPEAECRRYGPKFVAGLGFQPQRRMGFIYEAVRNEDSSITLTSQSVDNSTDEAFNAVRAVAVYDGEAKLDELVAVYDQTLGNVRGGHFVAGREIGADGIEENAWHAIERHRDVLDYYFENLMRLAKQEHAPFDVLEVEKKRLTYGVWATLKQRLDRDAVSGRTEVPESSPSELQAEIQNAYYQAVLRADVLFGCGGAMGAEEAMLSASSKDVFDLIFGREASPETAQAGVMRCVNCPKCRTYHHEVKAKKGWYHCSNRKCGNKVKA